MEKTCDNRKWEKMREQKGKIGQPYGDKRYLKKHIISNRGITTDVNETTNYETRKKKKTLWQMECGGKASVKKGEKKKISTEQTD